MSRKRIANDDKHHAITFRSDQHEGDRIILIRGGKRSSYLWTRAHDAHNAVTLSGEASLRALAYAILEQVGYSDE